MNDLNLAIFIDHTRSISQKRGKQKMRMEATAAPKTQTTLTTEAGGTVGPCIRQSVLEFVNYSHIVLLHSCSTSAIEVVA